jgi:hypothetical protein
MLRCALAFVGGCVLTSAVCLCIVIPSVRTNWQLQGLNDGRIGALYEVAQTLLRITSSKTAACVATDPVFQVKTTTVQAVDCGGVPSVRVIP